MSKSIVVVGSGHAAMCVGIAALEGGAQVIMFEKADEVLAGGNTKYIAGEMRFAYDNGDDLLPLLQNPDDPAPRGDGLWGLSCHRRHYVYLRQVEGV